MNMPLRFLVLVVVAFGLLACGEETPPAAEAPSDGMLSSGGEVPTGPSVDDVTQPSGAELDEEPMEDPYEDDEAHGGDDDEEAYDDDEDGADDDDEADDLAD